MKWSVLACVGAALLVLFAPQVQAGDENCCEYSSYSNDYFCYDHGNCTWWGRFMRADLDPLSLGNAGTWLTLAGNAGWEVSSQARPGSIAVNRTQAGLGHVVYVTKLNSNGSFEGTEMGYNAWDCARTNTFAAGWAHGFIHFKAPAANITTAQQKIASCRSANSWLGSLVSATHEWRPSGGNGRWVYIADYANGSVIFDMVGGATKAVAVPSYFMGPWATDKGCAGSNLGCPIGGRYSWNSGTRQDFEYGYLFYKSGINIGPYTWNGTQTGPGVLQNKFRSVIYSALVGEGYSRNGGRNTIGLPASGSGLLAYLHNVLYTTALVQDFASGSWSNAMIIYDTQAPLYATVVSGYLPANNTTNQACELHGGLRGYWETHGRFTGIGYPFTDEFTSSGIVKQRFIKRSGGRWVGTELQFQNGAVTQHSLFNQQMQGEQPDIDIVNEMESRVTAPESGLVQQPMLVSPNPMRTSSQIICRVPSVSDLKLEVFDASGRLVRRIASVSNHPAGQFQFGWDARSDEGHQVSTGVYFFRLALDDQIQTQRMVLVR